MYTLTLRNLLLVVPPRLTTAGCLGGLLALVALIMTGCSSNSGTAQSVAVDATAIASRTATSPDEVSLSDLIAPPAVSFQIVFRLYDRPGHSSYFFWRQGNGRRRWDYVPITPDGIDQGHFSLEIDFPGSRFGDPSLGCGWSTRPPDLGPGEAYLMCGEGGWSSFYYDPVTIPLESSVGEQLSEETIAGRRASCYSLQPMGPRRFDRALVCLDSASGIPLRIEIDDAVNGVDMIAISVSLDKQDLVVPVELQPVPDDPLGALRVFNGAVPMTTLQLPDLSQLGTQPEPGSAP
jgi:hypothetical protein